MTVPNRENAIVESRKLTDYLLSSEHPVGRHKAPVFWQCGYELEQVDRLIRAFRSVLWTGDIERKLESTYGTKYVVDGSLPCDGGGELKVRTVWIVEQDESAPRFVTGYPR